MTYIFTQRDQDRKLTSTNGRSCPLFDLHKLDDEVLEKMKEVYDRWHKTWDGKGIAAMTSVEIVFSEFAKAMKWGE